MKKYKKYISLGCIAVFCMLMLTGCFDTELAEGYDKNTIISEAEAVISDATVNGLEKALENRMRQDYKENYPIGEMNETLLSLISGKGNFMAFSQKSVIGKKSPDGKEDFAVALVTATYENGEIVYTITYDKEMNIISFYCK